MSERAAESGAMSTHCASVALLLHRTRTRRSSRVYANRRALAERGSTGAERAGGRALCRPSPASREVATGFGYDQERGTAPGVARHAKTAWRWLGLQLTSSCSGMARERSGFPVQVAPPLGHEHRPASLTQTLHLLKNGALSRARL